MKIGASSRQGSGLPPPSAAAPIGSKPKRMLVAAGAMPRRLTSAASSCPRILGLRAEIEVERDAGVEMHAVERARDRRLGGVETVAVGADRAGEHEREPGRAVLEIVQRLRIGGRRIGMVDALHDRPGGARRAGGDRLRGGARGRRAARCASPS